jgi:hypothetical protein
VGVVRQPVDQGIDHWIAQRAQLLAIELELVLRLFDAS